MSRELWLLHNKDMRVMKNRKKIEKRLWRLSCFSKRGQKSWKSCLCWHINLLCKFGEFMFINEGNLYEASCTTWWTDAQTDTGHFKISRRQGIIKTKIISFVGLFWLICLYYCWAREFLQVLSSRLSACIQQMSIVSRHCCRFYSYLFSTLQWI